MHEIIRTTVCKCRGMGHEPRDIKMNVYVYLILFACGNMSYELAILIEYRHQRVRCARRRTPRRDRHSSVRRYAESWRRPRAANAATRARAENARPGEP